MVGGGGGEAMGGDEATDGGGRVSGSWQWRREAAQTTVEFEVCFRSTGEAGKAEACWSTWNGGETHLGDLTASTLAPQE